MADRVELLIKLNGDTAAIRALQSIEQMVNGLNGKNININMNGAMHQVYSLRDAINGIGTAVSTVGNQIGTLGSAFTGLGNMFGGDILNIATRTLVSKATSIATQGIGKAVSRYDTFKTYPKLLELMGFSAEDAQGALDKLNDAVLGLPTSLDEMAEMSKQFIMFYQDIEKGTDLAIAANNAFLANGSDSQQVTFGLRQIRDILSKGTLKSMEWESLLAALGTSLVPIAEQFGYTADQIGEFRSALKNGDIDGMDFLDALIAVGLPGGVLAERANLLKDTLDAAATNIRTAFANLGASVLQELDKVLDEQTGKNLVENLVGISDAMKKQLIPAVRDWISSHPEEIVEIFNDLKSFDWMSLLSSIGTGAVSYFEHVKALFEWLVDTFGQENIIKFITFATVWASPLGRVLTLISKPVQLLGSMISLFARAPGLGMIGRLSRKNVIVQMAQTFADVFKVLIGAAGMVGVMYLFGQVIKEYVGIAEMIGHADFGNFNANFPVVTSLMGNMLFIVGGVTALMTAINALGGTRYVVAGELETAGLLGLVWLAGQVLDSVADLMVKVGGMNIGSYASNMEAVTELFNILFAETGFLTILFSAVSAIPGGALAVGAGELLTGGLLAEIDYAIGIIRHLVGLMGDISDVKLPTDAKINNVGHVLGEIAKMLKDIDFRTSLNLAKIGNVTILSVGLMAFYNLLDYLDKITKKDINKDAITKRLDELGEIMESFGKLNDKITGSSHKWVPDSLESLSEFLQTLFNLGNVLGDILLMLASGALINQIDKIDPTKIGALGEMFISLEEGSEGLTWKEDPFQIKMRQLDEIMDGVRDFKDGISERRNNLQQLLEDINVLLVDGMVAIYNDILKNVGNVIETLQGLHPENAGAFGHQYIDLTQGDGSLQYDDPLTTKLQRLDEIIQGVEGFKDSIGKQRNNIMAIAEEINLLLIDGIVATYNSILENFDKVIGTISDVDPTEAGAFGNPEDPFTEKVERLTEIGTALNDFEDAIQDFNTVIGGEQEAMKAALQNLVLFFEGESIDLIKELINKVAGLDLSDIEGINDENSAGFIKTMNQISIMLSGLQLAMAPLDSYWGPLGTSIKAWNEFWKNEEVINMANSTASLNTFMTNMRSLVKNQGWINNTTEEEFETFIENAAVAIQAFDDLLNSDNLTKLYSLTTGAKEISSSGFSAALEEYVGVVSAIRRFVLLMNTGDVDPVETVKSFLVTLGIVETILNKINGMQELIEQFSEEDNLGQKFGTIMDTLLAAFGGEDVEESLKLMQEMVPFMESINEVLLAIVEVNLETLNEQLYQLIEYIIDLANTQLPNLITQSGNAAIATENLATKVQQLGNEADLASPKIDNLSTQISILTEEMIIAYDNAISLAAAIMAIPDRTIHFGVDGMQPLMPTPLATGGLVDWSPQGTDIIPAILTPGEFVIRRRAAQTLGTRVLQQLNNLNIPGAIDALMSRISLPSTGRVIAYDNRRTYDNHATINQNIVTNNPAFTYRRASRFVGAL